MGLYPSQIYSHLVVPHLVLYSALGLLPLVWPLAPCAPSCVGCYLVGFAALLWWQVILGELPGRCTQCAHSATTWP